MTTAAEFATYADLKDRKAHKCGYGIFVVVEGDVGHVYVSDQGSKLVGSTVYLRLIKSDVMDPLSKSRISAAPLL